jgi:glycosyltransferase involved in cell wall biosynthesis
MISAAICTLDRSDLVVEAVQSVLASEGVAFELLVIDQSCDSRTREALAPWIDDPRLRYVRFEARGVARSRNLALQQARGDVVAFTDDDCVVPTDWLARMQEPFVRLPSVVLAFCNVKPAAHDPSKGFIPAYRRKGTVVVGSALQKCSARGIGAGMAVRRQAVLEMGGFDEMLGPGGTLRSAEDYDLSLRAVLAGHKVYETDEVEVVHFGFRTWEEGRTLTLRDWYGIGAAYSKPIKSGHLRFLIVPLYELLWIAVWPLLRNLVRLRRPRGLKRLAGFAGGMVHGLRTPLDRRSLKFVGR